VTTPRQNRQHPKTKKKQTNRHKPAYRLPHRQLETTPRRPMPTQASGPAPPTFIAPMVRVRCELRRNQAQAKPSHSPQFAPCSDPNSSFNVVFRRRPLAVKLSLAARSPLPNPTMLRLQLRAIAARLVSLQVATGLFRRAHRGSPRNGWGYSKGRKLRGIVRQFPYPRGISTKRGASG